VCPNVKPNFSFVSLLQSGKSPSLHFAIFHFCAGQSSTKAKASVIDVAAAAAAAAAAALEKSK
jgi:hypothetical protein